MCRRGTQGHIDIRPRRRRRRRNEMFERSVCGLISRRTRETATDPPGTIFNHSYPSASNTHTHTLWLLLSHHSWVCLDLSVGFGALTWLPASVYSHASVHFEEGKTGDFSSPLLLFMCFELIWWRSVFISVSSSGLRPLLISCRRKPYQPSEGLHWWLCVRSANRDRLHGGSVATELIFVWFNADGEKRASGRPLGDFLRFVSPSNEEPQHRDKDLIILCAMKEPAQHTWRFGWVW